MSYNANHYDARANEDIVDIPTAIGVVPRRLASNLSIMDYKHVKGVEVSTAYNPQMMLYTLGALEIFDGIYDINSVRMTIY